MLEHCEWRQITNGGAEIDADEWLRKNVGFVVSNSYYHEYAEGNLNGVHGGTRGLTPENEERRFDVSAAKHKVPSKVPSYL